MKMKLRRSSTVETIGVFVRPYNKWIDSLKKS